MRHHLRVGGVARIVLVYAADHAAVKDAGAAFAVATRAPLVLTHGQIDAVVTT